MPALPGTTGAAPSSPSGAVQARAERSFQVAIVGVLAGGALTAATALLVPLLVALDPVLRSPVRLFAVVIGIATAVAVAAFGPSGEPPGARLGTRVGSIVIVTGTLFTVGAGALAIGLGRPLGLALPHTMLAAILTGAIGAALGVGTLAGVAAGTSRAGVSLPSAGLSLRFLVGGATGTLTLATWALATAHLLGHFEASTRQTAVAEARDLVAIAATLPPGELERLAAGLAPPGGFLARIDAGGRVLPGVSVGLPRDALIRVDEGPPTTCQVAERDPPLPCAQREIGDGTRVVAGVSDVPIPTGVLLVFMIVGGVAALVAFAIGGMLGGGPGDELDRVAAVLDELGRSGQGGLDRPIPAVSLDEVGDLAVALAQLRLRLRPGLVEHDEALARAHVADQERERFLALVSEELRAPLDRILGCSRVLLEGGEPLQPAQREDVRLIVSSSTHLTELIEEVLDLSAIATGQVRLRLGDVDLGALAADVARAQRPLIGARPVELRVIAPERDARVRGDERRLRQVATNLISNAVKFTTEGTITITVARAPDAWVLSVADTGPGIAPEQLPRLFVEFVQLGTLRQRARGTGLGLAICKRLIEAHGGTVTADSVLGRGTTFTVRLPTTAAEDA